MAADIKNLIKPPFANYDVVVYFGCGLFFLPLIFHYFIEPTGLRFPRFQFHLGIEFADAAISTLSLLFAVYILGHILAYVASFIVEQSVDIAFGKMSSAIVISTLVHPSQQSQTIKKWIKNRLKKAPRNHSRFWIAIRLLALLPAAPFLYFSYLLDTFDYFKSRIPKQLFIKLKQKATEKGYGTVGLRTKWYKTVEHDVINNCPSATGRMYNYLIIGGIFRSLSLIFLLCAWAEVYYGIHRLVDSHEYVKAVMSDNNFRFSHILMYVVYNVLFLFCVTAYIKFSRRYVEEALFAFVLAKTD